MRRRILQSTLLVVTITALVLGAPLAVTTWRLVEDITRADLTALLERVEARLEAPAQRLIDLIGYSSGRNAASFRVAPLPKLAKVAIRPWRLKIP